MASFEKKTKKNGRPNQVHPGLVCCRCAKCGSCSSPKWRHKIGYSQEYLDYIKTEFDLQRNDCLCNACYISLDKLYNQGPPPVKKPKNNCHVCPAAAGHTVTISNITSFLNQIETLTELSPTNFKNGSESNVINLCDVHLETWKDLRFEDRNFNCAVPTCRAFIGNKSSTHPILDFHLLKDHFKAKGEDWFLELSEDCRICNKCRQTFMKIRASLDPNPSTKSDNSSPGIPSISDLITKFKTSTEILKTSEQIDYENFVLTETFLFLAINLHSDIPIFLSEVVEHFKTSARSIASGNTDILEKCEKRSPLWLRMKIETAFETNIELHSFQKNGIVDKRKGTLILRKNADLVNIIHQMCLRNRNFHLQMNRLQEEPTDAVNEDCQILTDAYQTVIMDMSRRYQCQAKIFKTTFENTDLSKINFNSIAKSIDPYIWNFHYLVSQTKNEWKTLKTFPLLDCIKFENELSAHYQNRVLRTLFSVCHMLYQVSNGDCANPLHILLADTIDSYSGSAKLSSTLNSFGLICSKYRVKDHVESIVNRKNMSKFMDDLNIDSFTIVSVDNIDIGQPHASVTLGYENRGIHATSYQAVQPKPSSLLTSKEADNDIKLFSTPTKIPSTSFTLNNAEQASFSSLSDLIFQYIVQKNAIENTDAFIPNLKCHLSQLNEPKTEASNVAYLGVLNEPCDNTETVKHIIEKIHDIFDVSSQNKHMVLVGDAKTYELFCKLKTEYSEELEWIIPFPGDWHILKNTQPVLIKIYFDAGLREIAKITHKEEGLLTVLQQCSNFRKTHLFLLDAWECFYRAQIKCFLDFREKNLPLSQCKLENEEIMTKLLDYTLKSHDQQFEQIKKLSSDICNELEIKGLKNDFYTFTEKMCQTDDTFHFWHDFVHKHGFSYVALYLSFRSSNWNLRLAALKNLAPLYHAYDRHMYLRLIPKHLADIATMPICILHQLQNGGFTATKSGNSWQQLALDEAHESFINLDVKESVRKPSPDLLDTMSVYLPYRASLQNNINSQLQTNSKATAKNKEFSMSFMKQQNDICSEYMKKIMSSNVFDYSINTNRGLIQLFTDNKAEGGLHFDLMNFYDIGLNSMNMYIKSRILQEPSVQVPVRKHTLKTFTTAIPKKRVKKFNENQEKLLYSRCIKKEMAFSISSGQPLKKFYQYIPLPRAICNSDGSINHQDTKSNATRHLGTRYSDIILEKLPCHFKPELVILEGMFIINSAPIRSHHKTFSDHIKYLARRWICPHLRSGAKEIHILFDRPGALSEDGSPTLKDLERSRRDNTKQSSKTYESLHISSDLPKCRWLDFLLNRENKRNFIKLFSEYFLHEIKPSLSGQTCILNGCFDDGNCYGISSDSDIFQLPHLTSNHEETDTLIWLHVLQSTHKKILIFSPDTDVFFIGLSFASDLHVVSNKELCIQMNTLGENVKYLHLNKLIDSLARDPDLVSIEPLQLFKCVQVLYICSGCDYVSFFRGYGKAMFFSTLFQFSQFICGGQLDVTGSLADTSADKKEMGFLAFLRLIGSLYFKKNATEFLPDFTNAGDIFKDFSKRNPHIPTRQLHEEWLSLIRDKVQARASYEDDIPPSSTALYHHWLRSCLVSQMYDQASKNSIILPSYSDYGYHIQNNCITPIWDDQKHIETVENRVKWLLRGCKCKKGCIKNNCKCKKSGQTCGPGCQCVNCQNCINNNKCSEIEIEESVMLTDTESETDDDGSQI